MQPAQLLLWEHVDPGAAQSGRVKDDIQGCINEDVNFDPSCRASIAERSQLQRAAGAQEPAGAPSSAATAAATAGADNEPPPLPPGDVWLQFFAERAEGGDATLLDGTCDGAPAVIKVFLWDLEGLAAYHRERTAYDALAPLQGSAVPQVLAKGMMAYNLRYVAMRPVEGGRPLSAVARPCPPAVARAALRALEAAQAVCGGFVHGDISLDNILLVDAQRGATVPGTAAAASGAGGAVAGAAGSGDGGDGGGDGGGGGEEPRCVLLDFARSRLDGSAAQQAEERARLRRLLGLAGG